jgi:hypothetical protein
MKLLTRVYDPDLIFDLRLLLENAGIPTLIHTHGCRDMYYYLLFVVIDDQLEDAIKLLKNPNHIVSNPVYIDEYESAEMPEGQLDKGTQDRFESFFIVLICVFALLVIIYRTFLNYP